jgi:hypothetical protein
LQLLLSLRAFHFSCNIGARQEFIYKVEMEINSPLFSSAVQFAAASQPPFMQSLQLIFKKLQSSFFLLKKRCLTI